MSSNLMQYEYLGQGVRILEENGEALFVASDVARVLCHRDATAMVRALDEDERGTRPTCTPGGTQDVTVLTESGFYHAVLLRQTGRMSDPGTKDAVKAFQRWVTHEVLPQIRKTGAYSIDRTPQLPKSADQLVLEAMQILTARVEESTAKIAELEPKANAWAQFLASTGDVSVNEAAKALSRNSGRVIGEHKLRRLLESKRWIYRDAKRNPRAYQVQIDRGRLAERARTYEDRKTGERVHAAPQVRITSKGLDAIRDFLSEADR